MDKVDPSIMKPGMTARVRIPLVLANDTPVIPREYLGLDSQGRYFILKKETESKTAGIRYVTVGAIGDRLVQALSGVSIGDPLLSMQHLAEVSK
jgi:hypothetical protein